MKQKAKKAIKFAVKSAVHPGNAKRSIQFELRRRKVNADRRAGYINWFEANKASDAELAKQRKLEGKLKIRPLVSVLIPTYNTNPVHLRECIESVIAQTYTNWEICISDDASSDKDTIDVIREYVKKYSNIRATLNKTNRHIAGSSNVALAMAKGKYISLLDHDDLLTPDALYETVSLINRHPDVDLVYTDEDKLEDDKTHIEPFFKPSWSPDFLNSCNYITHFATLSRKVMDEVGGFTEGTQGAQDWDLFLRVTAVTGNIRHVPKILYIWRKSITSTAQSANSKPYAYINQKKVLRRSVIRNGEDAAVEAHPALGFWRVHYSIEGSPLVSIIIPTKNSLKYITQCVDSILEKTDYPYFEIVIVDTGSTDTKVIEYYEMLTKNNPEVKIVYWKADSFNFSEACNYGAANSTGEYLLFLNNDTEVISPDWIQGLLEHAQRIGVGMVGAKLLFENDTIQHGGIVLSERDIAFHPFYGKDPRLDIFEYIYVANVRNTAAVTAACSMVARSKFDQVGGFDPMLRVTYNDVDLCLRLLDKGYRNVYNPFVELYHYESISVGRINTTSRDADEFNDAKTLMTKRWAEKYLRNDPYYNPSFSQYGPGFELPEA
jgi:glycosyltransferase involved in cell wall biosynthesis